MEIIIYKVTNLVNNKMYVGQTRTTLQKRWYNHVHAAKGKVNVQQGMPAAIAKYGRDNFKIEPLLICSHEMSDFYENLCIEGFNTMAPCGYNLRKAKPHFVDYEGVAKGERHGCSKLTEEDVFEIRNNTNLSVPDVVRLYKISTANVKRIRNGTSWSHSFKPEYLNYKYRAGNKKGLEHHAGILSDEDKLQISQDTTTPTRVLADKYKVCYGSIQLLRKGMRVPYRDIAISDVQFILDNPDISNMDLSDKTGLSLSFVSRVKSKKTYTNLTSNATPEQWEVYYSRKQKYSNKDNK